MKCKSGFTLIEVIIVIVIISILAGIMVPVVYKYWDTENIDITKDRMNLLKISMVGDPRLMQNGVRTSFGYVGEHGELPGDLNELIGFGNLDLQNDNFKKDAWGNVFLYIYNVDVQGRRSSGKIISQGADGRIGTSDDIELIIDEKEVFPTNNLLSKIDIFMSTPPQENITYYFKISVENKSGTGSCCKPVNILGSSGNTKTHYTTDLQCVFDENFPIGVSVFTLEAFSDSECNNKIFNQSSEQNYVVIGDRVNSISINQKIFIQWVIL